MFYFHRSDNMAEFFFILLFLGFLFANVLGVLIQYNNNWLTVKIGFRFGFVLNSFQNSNMMFFSINNSPPLRC